MHGAVVFCFFCCIVAVSVSDNFFDLDNFTHLDCIPDRYKKVYAYYGDRRTAIGKRSEPFCAKWSNAIASIQRHVVKKRQPVALFGYLPDEFLFHDECRNLQLDLIAGSQTDGQPVTHFFLSHPGWQQGPWCYVWSAMMDMYEPHPCFESCPGNWTPTVLSTTTAPTTTSPTSVPIRYNRHLLEHLHFDKYVWGDLSYYDLKPSDDPLSDSFLRNRETMFYVLCGVVGILLAFFTAKGALSVIHEQKRKKRRNDNAAVGSESIQKIEARDT